MPRQGRSSVPHVPDEGRRHWLTREVLAGLAAPLGARSAARLVLPALPVAGWLLRLMRPLIQPGISQGVGRVTLGGVSLSATRGAWAGGQQYETLSDAVRVALSKAIAAPVSAEPLWASREQRIEWMTQMSDRLPRRHFPDFESRQRFLRTVRYEAQRAGLEPELVLGLIQVESAFRQYAISSVGARGYMQVMPFWTKVLGDGDAKRLFNPRINIRYGCVILRHYLDIEKGDLFLALGRYNGSRGRDPYPNAVFAAWDRWRFQPGSRSHSRTADAETAVPASVPRRASAATGMPQPKP